MTMAARSLIFPAKGRSRQAGKQHAAVLLQATPHGGMMVQLAFGEFPEGGLALSHVIVMDKV